MKRPDHTAPLSTAVLSVATRVASFVAATRRTLMLFLAGLMLSSIAHADTRRIEQNHASITYQGNWQTISGAGVSGGSVAATNQAPASAEVRFTGTAIRWIGYRCACAAGSVRVYLDGDLLQTFDTYAANTEAQAEIFRVAGLHRTDHVLRIELTGGGNSAGSSHHVVIDAFEIDDGAEGPLISETNSAVTYTGTWIDVDEPQAYGGRLRASQQAGAVARFTFNGTGMRWIGYRCPCAGTARLRLDGEIVATVDSWAATRQPLSTLYSVDGLPAGTHVFEIEVTGEGTGTAAYVGVDAFQVTNSFGDILNDTLPPYRAIVVEPTRASSTDGWYWIAARAYDNAGIAGVSFYVDGVLINREDANGWPYAVIWDAREVSNGEHRLTAVARDAAGNVVESSGHPFTVDNTVDTEPPVVIMNAPANGSTVTGTVSIGATVTDRIGVTRVRFYADAVGFDNVFLGEDTTAPFSIERDTSSVPSGTRVGIHAQAYDPSGNIGYSGFTIVTVDHQDGTRPLVAITAPAAGATVSGMVRIAAEATDDQGIANVTWYTTGQHSLRGIRMDDSAPYEFVAGTFGIPDGEHLLYAQAVDVSGITSELVSQTVIVDNSVAAGRVRVDDDDAAAVYTGNWSSISDTGRLSGRVYHWNGATISETPGASVRFTFTGTGVRWIGPSCFECGAADVAIDGGTPQTVIVDGVNELGSPDQRMSYVLYTSPTLPFGTHTLDITVRNYEFAQAGGFAVVIDAFEVLNP